MLLLPNFFFSSSFLRWHSFFVQTILCTKCTACVICISCVNTLIACLAVTVKEFCAKKEEPTVVSNSEFLTLLFRSHEIGTFLQLCFYKNIIDGANRPLKVIVADTDDNIQLAGALIDHFYIDLCMCQG